MIAHLYGLSPDLYSEYAKLNPIIGFPGDASFVKFQVDLYAIADKYQVPSLCQHAALVDGLSSNTSRDRDRQDVYDVAKYIYIPYPDEAEGLRTLVSKRLIAYYKKRRQHHSAFKRLLEEAPRLKADFEKLVAAGARRKGRGWTGRVDVPLNYHSGQSEFDTESESDSE